MKFYLLTYNQNQSIKAGGVKLLEKVVRKVISVTCCDYGKNNCKDLCWKGI